MFKVIKRLFLKLRLVLLYRKIQRLTRKKFSLRMKDIKLGQKFNTVVESLKKLGCENPKEIVLGKRPPTGKIK